MKTKSYLLGLANLPPLQSLGLLLLLRRFRIIAIGWKLV